MDCSWRQARLEKGHKRQKHPFEPASSSALREFAERPELRDVDGAQQATVQSRL